MQTPQSPRWYANAGLFFFYWTFCFIQCIIFGRKTPTAGYAEQGGFMIHQASGALGWMLPDAESKKMELLGAPWETIIKWYLWYELGEIRELNPQEWDTVIEQCFVSGGKGFGDVEFHTSRTIPGNPSLLRIRGPEIRLLPALVIRGRYCPLYQRGCGDILGRNPAPDLINFHIEWEKMMTADGEKV